MLQLFCFKPDPTASALRRKTHVPNQNQRTALIEIDLHIIANDEILDTTVPLEESAEDDIKQIQIF